MARVLHIIASQLIISTLLSSFIINQVIGEDHEFGKTLDREQFSLKEEKLSHFHFYFQDIYSGPKPTAVGIVRPPNKTVGGFGVMSMIDNPLTMGPELSSKLVGRAQGFYGQASQEEAGLIMVMNFVFLEGKYNGSTLAVLGRNKVFSEVREMPIVGGSGLFRFARGYVEARTYNFSFVTGDATVEYNAYVLHY